MPLTPGDLLPGDAEVLSFFDDAAARAAKRRKLLSEEVNATGTLELNGNKTETVVEIEAIPLQESSMFTGATKYMDDIADRPEEVSVQDEQVFKSMPVEAFGMAMLRGMGWTPGGTVGGTVKAVVEPYVPETRGGRMGIGAIKAMEEDEDEEEIERRKKQKQQDRDTARAARAAAEAATAASSSSASGAGAAASSSTLSWLCTGIRVRVVDETTRLGGGAWYGQKGVVDDILPDNAGLMCTLIMGSGGGKKTLSNVKEAWLSTALPKKGGRIMVVKGQQRGSVGVLLKRDKKREQATVQLDTTKDGTTTVVGYDDLSEICVE